MSGAPECVACRFFATNASYWQAGECRINPPVVVGPDRDGDICTRWPIVEETEWCGQFGASA